jgi:N-methylhydantoinase A
VTDAALLLGWLDPGQPLADALVLDRDRAEHAVGRVARDSGLSVERCAEGIVEVANAAMVRALRRVSVERGIDPRHMTLVAFGGAGPLFACRVAEALGMRRALVPPFAGVLSALGLAAAPARIEFVASLHQEADTLDPELAEQAYRSLEEAAATELPGAASRRFADCRYPGQGYELVVPADSTPVEVARAFHRTHRERFGHANPARPVEVVNVRIVASRPGTPVHLAGHTGTVTAPPTARARVQDLAPGTTMSGPYTLDAPDCTIRIESSWQGTVHASGALVLETV